MEQGVEEDVDPPAKSSLQRPRRHRYTGSAVWILRADRFHALVELSCFVFSSDLAQCRCMRNQRINPDPSVVFAPRLFLNLYRPPAVMVTFRAVKALNGIS